jgi:IS30 family transposase
MVRRKLTIPERWQALGMHNGGISHRRVADHFSVNHSIIVRLMQRQELATFLVWLIFAAPYQTN